MIQRQLTYQARRSVPPQRGAGHAAPAVYAWSCSSSSTSSRSNPEQQEAGGRDAGDGGGGQASARELRRRLRHGRKSARRREIHHVNFLGGARTAGVHAPLVDPRSRHPPRFQPALRVHAATSRWGRKGSTGTPSRPLTSSIVTGGKVTLTQRPSRCTSWSVSFTERTQQQHDLPTTCATILTLRNDLIALGLDPDDRTARTARSNAFGFDFQRSTADNLLNARRGYQFALHAELGGTTSAGHVQLSTPCRPTPGTTCRFGDASSIANRVQLGSIDAVAAMIASNVPFAKKYFLGGATSMRGWGRYEVSPLSESGLADRRQQPLRFQLRAPRGRCAGRSAACCSSTPATSGPTNGASCSGDLVYAGGGRRCGTETPVGPVRFDFGYQLNRIDGLLVDGAEQTRPWRLHFSIGQAF